MKLPEPTIEGIDFVQHEFTFSKSLDTSHYVEEPSACFLRFLSEKKRSLPFLKNSILGTNDTILHNMNLARIRNTAKQDVRADPAGTPGRWSKRLAFLNEVAGKEMLWYDK